jgi:hypothetical protein
MHVNTGFRPHFHIIPTPGKRTSPCPEPEETGFDTMPVFRFVQTAGRIPPSQRQWCEYQR